VAAAAAAAAALMEETPQEDDDRPVHQRLFSTVEEPCVMPMPPTEKEAEEDAKQGEKTQTETAGPAPVNETDAENGAKEEMEEKEIAPDDMLKEGSID